MIDVNKIIMIMDQDMAKVVIFRCFIKFSLYLYNGVRPQRRSRSR
jgi:hypothetical protein